MKRFIICLYFFIHTLALFSITVPFSNQLIKSDSNHISNFIRVSPNDKIESPLGIDVWLWHNQKTIFVYWEVEIDSNFVEGNFNQKDLPPKSDELRMQIITNYLDNSAYTFWATPKSNSIDAIRLPNMQFDMNWNSNYTYKSKVTDTLWVVLTDTFINIATRSIGSQIKSTRSSIFNSFRYCDTLGHLT